MRRDSTPLHAVETMIAIMDEKTGGNVNILRSPAFSGIAAALITQADASKAGSQWAFHSIKTRKGALLSAIFPGSPISDTTILASAGARCDYISRVFTQIPYVLCAAAVCFFGYPAAGTTGTGWVGTGMGLALMAVVLIIINKKNQPAGQGRETGGVDEQERTE